MAVGFEVFYANRFLPVWDLFRPLAGRWLLVDLELIVIKCRCHFLLRLTVVWIELCCLGRLEARLVEVIACVDFWGGSVRGLTPVGVY